MSLRTTFALILFLAVGGGALFLATRMIPAPHHVIEKAIGHERFFK